MAYGSVNSTGASETEMQEAKEEVKKVSDKIGTTEDTGGNETSGTVFGKINKAISDLATHMGRWTGTRAGYIDIIKASTDKIGETGDTGGSATAGTVFGKLNKLISDLSTHISAWTSTRAGNIDTINTNTSAIKDKTDTIGETGDTGGSDTTGTVMGKLNKVLENQGTGVVKSIQRGVWKITPDNTIDGSNYKYAIDIGINQIDSSKSIALVGGCQLELLRDTKLRLGASLTGTANWQVIEFY